MKEGRKEVRKLGRKEGRVPLEVAGVHAGGRQVEAGRG